MRASRREVLKFGVAALLGAGLAGACRRRLDRPHVLLMTLDTTRADRLGCYGKSVSDLAMSERASPHPATSARVFCNASSGDWSAFLDMPAQLPFVLIGGLDLQRIARASDEVQIPEGRALVKQGDVGQLLGSKGRVSEVINGKRAISKAQAKALADFFHVSAELFI